MSGKILPNKTYKIFSIQQILSARFRGLNENIFSSICLFMYNEVHSSKRKIYGMVINVKWRKILIRDSRYTDTGTVYIKLKLEYCKLKTYRLSFCGNVIGN